jgi:hypothetical protein
MNVSHDTAEDDSPDLLSVDSTPSVREKLAKEDSFSDYDRKHDVAPAAAAAPRPLHADRGLEEAFSYRSLMSKRPAQSAADMHTPATKGFQRLVHKMQAQRAAQRKLLQSLSPGPGPSVTPANVVATADGAEGGSLTGPESHVRADSDISVSVEAVGDIPAAPVCGYPPGELELELDSPVGTRQAERAHQLVEKMDRLRADAKSRRGLAGPVGAATSTTTANPAAVPVVASDMVVLDAHTEAVTAGSTAGTAPEFRSRVVEAQAEPVTSHQTERPQTGGDEHPPTRARNDTKPPTSSISTPNPKSLIPKRVKAGKRPVSGGVSNYSRIGFSSGSGGGAGSGCDEASKYSADDPFASANSVPGRQAAGPVDDAEERPLRPLGVSLESLLVATESGAGGEAGSGVGGASESAASAMADAAPAVEVAPAAAASQPTDPVVPSEAESEGPQGCHCAVS